MMTILSRKVAMSKLLFPLLLLILPAANLTMLHTIDPVQDKELIPFVPLAVGIDFCLVLPLLYFVIHKRKPISRWIIPILLMTAGYIGSALLLSAYGYEAEHRFGFILLPIILLLGWLSFHRIRHMLQACEAGNPSPASGYDAIRRKIAIFLSKDRGLSYWTYEACMYYYALGSWGQKAVSRQAALYHADAADLFTYHKNSNALLMVYFLAFALTLEGVAFHLLIAQWSHIAAWILTISNVYVLLSVLGNYRAMKLSPIVVKPNVVQIRYGLSAQLDIPLHQITAVTAAVYELEVTKEQRNVAIVVGSDAPNVLIECAEPVEATLPFGMKRSSTHIYLMVDHAEDFRQRLLDNSTPVR
ncbi:hypothetical protein [Paenibacillus chungangensis]|uniref:Beta-carotene 15,15'-monooxygenase n=1 Tax=Paenibacillus chungangensis TaxID=696535 RepID=A0ABW3HTA7_9BACL